MLWCCVVVVVLCRFVLVCVVDVMCCYALFGDYMCWHVMLCHVWFVVWCVVVMVWFMVYVVIVVCDDVWCCVLVCGAGGDVCGCVCGVASS